jgi:energy-coupling factor transporter ATP-binding protein EcfA2
MAIEHEIVNWAKTRPWWQQEVLGRLAAGHPIDQTYLSGLVDDLISNASRTVTPLSVADLPAGQAQGKPVALEAIRDLQGINALLPGQALTLASSGLTVIYGHNASGKSGYARLVKLLAGARHNEAILPDVFAQGGSPKQSASISFSHNGTSQLLAWPSAASALQAIHFYDEACGNAYLGGDSELTYRPSALVLLDDLIAACDALREMLDQRLRKNSETKGPLPQPPEGTPAQTFVEHLSATTSGPQIDEAAKVPDKAEEELASLLQEEGRLQASDPQKERSRLEGLGNHAQSLSGHIKSIELALNDKAVNAALDELSKTSALRAAAAIASSSTFDSEPIPGVGAETWRALWETAKTYSTTEAYCDHEFPATDEGARCVLCQQQLSPEASNRLQRFDAFMKDTTEQTAQRAETSLQRLIASTRGLAVSTASVMTSLVEMRGLDEALAEAISEWLRTADERRKALLERLVRAENDAAIPPLGASLYQRVAEVGSTLRTQAAVIDATAFQTQLGGVIARRKELQGRLALGQHRSQLTVEIRRLAERSELEKAKQGTDTAAITRKSSDLTRSHVTTVVRDRFTRESDQLRLERITLNDVGGKKGKLRHRPALLGATGGESVENVFSEGEQTALGLAGYFTEAFFDSSGSGMVLDDPVTSLDHVRRAVVANRLAEFGTKRQVIVFTHDATFVGDLRKAADEKSITFTERCIQRRGDTPGMCTDEHPWKVKDVGTRLTQMEHDLAEIKRDRATWTQEQYEDACAAWGGKLSELWERVLSLEVDVVVDRTTLEVRPRLFKVLAKITEHDNDEFQQSYGRASLWARRHDKNPAVNYVAPEPGEMEAELALVRAWTTRVKAYKK